MTPIKIKCVFLDKNSMDCDDLDFSQFMSLTDFSIHATCSDDEVISKAQDAEIIISNKVKLNGHHFAQLPRLKQICVIATGTNNIDHDAAAEYGITVVNVKDYAAASVSQHVFMLILSLSTSFIEYQTDVKNAAWQNQKQFCLLNHPMQELKGKTIGLIGYGHIAQAVESVALAFGMNVLIAQSFNPDNQSDDRVSVDVLLSKSDIISLHCPLSEQTQNLISEREFKLMKSSAIIINTARGGIINEHDLLQALNSGEIAAAGIDCLSIEPPEADNPMITADLPQLIVTPHNAWGTLQARQRLVDGTADNIEQYLKLASSTPSV